MNHTKTLKVGSRAPAFTLPGTDGRAIRLADYAGHRLVLVCYPLAWTPV